MTSANENQSPPLSAAPLSAEDLCGLFLPITTPFLSDETLDVNGLRANIRKWNLAGINGYVVMGSTGERVHLEEREYQQVIEAARHEVTGKLSLIAGAGQQSTRGTIAEIKRATAAGADAVLVITPSFYRAAITQAALVKHYTQVADDSPVPVLLYSMPDLTGIKIEPETVATLCRHPNIVGLKDSSADIERFTETVAQVRKVTADSAIATQFAMLTGNGTVFYQALLAGAQGGILAVGCVATALCVQILQAVRNQNNERAESLQTYLTPLARAVTKTYGIGGLKAALDMINYAGGAVRAPLPAAGEKAQVEIRNYLNAAETALQELSMKQKL